MTSPVASAMPASPNRSAIRIMAGSAARRSARRGSRRGGNEIRVADETGAARLDAAADLAAHQGGELVRVPVVRHGADERRRAARRRMEVQLADAVGQPVDEAQHPLLRHGAAPGEAEDVVVDGHARRGEPAAQQAGPEVERRDPATAALPCPAAAPFGGVDYGARLARHAHGPRAERAADPEDQPGDGWVQVYVVVRVDVVERQPGRVERLELRADLAFELTPYRRQE